MPAWPSSSRSRLPPRSALCCTPPAPWAGTRAPSRLRWQLAWGRPWPQVPAGPPGASRWTSRQVHIHCSTAVLLTPRHVGFACCVAGVPGQTCADKVLNSEQQTAQGTFPGASRCRSWHSSVCHVSGIVVAMLPCCVPRQRGCDVKDVAAGVERSLPPTAKGLDCRQGSLGECSQPQQGRCIWYAWYCNKHVQPGCCIIWCREQESR